MKRTFTKTDLHQKKRTHTNSPQFFLQRNLDNVTKPSGD